MQLTQITSRIEHHAVLQAFEYLQTREGYTVTWLPVNAGGRIDLDQLTEAIHDQTTLVSIMSANNETGTLQPVREAALACRQRGVLFHSDMIQSFGKEPVCARDFDAVSLASHKFGGPKGAGILYLGSGISIESVQLGGSHENARRPGTENAAAIVGMAAAAKLALVNLESEHERQGAMRDRLWAGLERTFPGVIFNGEPEHRLANTLNVSFPGIDAESLLINLDLAGICVSSGSACMVGSILPSHVLLAMGASADIARSTLRFSLGKETTPEQIEEVLRRLANISQRLQPIHA